MHTLNEWNIRTVTVALSLALIAIIAAVLPLRLSARSVIAEAPDGPPVRVLTVDWRTTFVTPSETIDLEKGGRSYSEADVFKPGDADTGAPIGEIKWNAIATEPPGVPGSLLSGVLRLFEEGDIHVSAVIDDVDGAKGVITGGTGRFGGATGVYWDAVFPGLGRATLIFSQVPAAQVVDRATIQGAITAYMKDNHLQALPVSDTNDLVGDTSTNDFSALTGILDLQTVGPSGFPFLANPTTTYFYCWDATGAVTVQDRVATLDCTR